MHKSLGARVLLLSLQIFDLALHIFGPGIEALLLAFWLWHYAASD